MNEILFYLAIGAGLTLLTLLVPGLKLIGETFLKLLIEGAMGIFRHQGNFLIWFIKTLSSDHIRILKHATTRRDELDPTQKVRRKAQGYVD